MQTEGVAETQIYNEWVNYLATRLRTSTSLREQSSCNQVENRCPTNKLTMFVMFATFGFIQHWTLEHVVDEAQIKHSQWVARRRGGKRRQLYAHANTGNCRKCAHCGFSGSLTAKHLNKTFNLLPLSIFVNHTMFNSGTFSTRLYEKQIT